MSLEIQGLTLPTRAQTVETHTVRSAVDLAGKRRRATDKPSTGKSQQRQQGEVEQASPGGSGGRIDGTLPVGEKQEPEDNEPKRTGKKNPSVFDLIEQSRNLPPGFNLYALAEVIQQERQTVYKDRILTYDEAYTRLRPYQSEHIQATQQAGQKYQAEHPDTNPFVTPAEAEKVKGEVAKVVPDRLEVVREAFELTSRREQLMNRLLTILSFKNGLKRFNEAFPDKPYRSIEEINKDYPNITATEITLLSLTKATPALFLKTGKQAPEQIVVTDDMDVDMYNVPRIIGANPSGLIVADELTDPNISGSAAPFTNLGMTQADSIELETAVFSEDIAGTKKRGEQEEGEEKENIIQELIVLTISSQRVFERIWDKAESALIDGIGKIDRMALGIVRPDLAASEEALRSLERQLDIADSIAYEQEKDRIQSTLAQATFGNMRSLEGFSMYDTVRLIGLLEKIPEVFLHANEPFHGFIDPDIHGVQFVDINNRTHSFVPYNPLYLRETLQGLYFEQIDVNVPNATMADIYNRLLNQAEAMSLDTEDLSLLEGIKADMKYRFDIDLELHPHMAIEDITLATAPRVSAKKIYEVGLKFGFEEAQDIYDVTSLLRKELLAGVKSVRKQFTRDVESAVGLGEGEHYFAKSLSDGTIILCQLPDAPWAFLPKEIKEFRKDAYLHEVAHHIWWRLSKEEKSEWVAIGWDQEGKPTVPPDPTWVLDQTLHADKFVENFCNHFPVYVLHGPEFREKAPDNEIARKKYEFIKKTIQRKTGLVIEYDEVSPLPMMYMEKFIVHPGEEVMAQKYKQILLELSRTQFAAEDAVEKVIVRYDRSLEPDPLMKAQIEEVEALGSVMEAHELDMTLITTLQREELAAREMELTELKSIITGTSDEGANELATQVYEFIKEGKITKARKLMRTEIDENDMELWAAFNILAKRIRQRFLGDR